MRKKRHWALQNVMLSKPKISTFEQPSAVLCSAQVLSKYTREIRGGFYNNMSKEKMQNKR
jgi:hypothetical protein